VGAYNTVVAPEAEACPACGEPFARRVQFKYGSCWAYEYAVGDTLRWGGNDKGERAPLAVALGYPEPCPHCGHDLDGSYYDVLIRDDVIAAVTPGSPAAYAADDYRILAQ
jgi:hypothetical protein